MQMIHPLSRIGSFGWGMFAAFLLLMAGDVLGWWKIEPPLRYAVMVGNSLAACTIVAGFLTTKTRRAGSPSAPDSEADGP